ERNNKVKSLGDFVDNNNRIVLGNAKATAIGEASAVILKKAGLNESNINIRARGISVKQLVMWIEKHNADASIVWKADAIQSRKVKPIDIPEQYISTYIIPVCQMIRHKEEASQYIHYLLSAEAKGIFWDYDFDVVK
ncbi:MAG: substrate-binding domain-containing protein, partial [Deltaproteobacteria bacterium]|nr:substrate-binding domain-containing protein [Deltaproteobacteria bacterium]